MSMAYYYIAKVLLSRSDAAKHIQGAFGGIETAKLDNYHLALNGALVFGVLSAFLLAIEVARCSRRELPNQAMQTDRPSADR